MRAHDIYEDDIWRGRGAWGGPGPFPHQHGHHGHGRGRGDFGPERGRGPWARDDELGRQVGKLFGAVRAAAHTDDATRLAASRLLDETARDLYRLLADAPGPTQVTPTPDDPAPAA
ncbi:MAG TPA: hypothetical protein VKV06_00730 [Acidimicrobiales bacterium]|nr:hypothetical protein [Acidimicrobiales bacterium]